MLPFTAAFMSACVLSHLWLFHIQELIFIFFTRDISGWTNLVALKMTLLWQQLCCQYSCTMAFRVRAWTDLNFKYQNIFDKPQGTATLSSEFSFVYLITSIENRIQLYSLYSAVLGKISLTFHKPWQVLQNSHKRDKHKGRIFLEWPGLLIFLSCIWKHNCFKK